MCVTGITAENRDEVRSLACESRFERSVRKAALLMYWKLNPERKREITPSELLENMSQLNDETGKTGVYFWIQPGYVKFLCAILYKNPLHYLKVGY